MPLQRNSVPWSMCLHWLSLEDPSSRNPLVVIILEPQDMSGKVKTSQDHCEQWELGHPWTQSHLSSCSQGGFQLQVHSFRDSLVQSFEGNTFTEEATEAHEQ